MNNSFVALSRTIQDFNSDLSVYGVGGGGGPAQDYNLTAGAWAACGLPGKHDAHS